MSTEVKRNDQSAEAKRIWKAVDLAASRVPAWAIRAQTAPSPKPTQPGGATPKKRK